MAASQSSVFDRTDTSICPHLSALLSAPSASSRNPGSPGANGNALVSPLDTKGAEIEKRFVDVVKWGALPQGVKRRKRHWKSSGRKCAFAIDPFTGTIFCEACGDTTYPDTFESLYLTTRIRVEESNDHSREPGVVSGKARGRGEWKSWNSGNSALSEREVAKTSCRGLRPLLNLSQTCFLSAILQALVHNPLLKAYFLSDRHNRYVCTNGGKGLLVGKPFLGVENGPGAVGSDRERGCMCCEMDKAFEEFYNEDKSPFGPITMLYAMWHASTELEGYGQQDQTFAGTLQSSVICSKCSKTSNTVDPILDIQLDFPPPSAPSPASSSSDSSAFGPSTNGQADQLTLAGMLRKFCAPERVGEPGGKGYECSGCGGGVGVVATRKLGVKKLAPVLSFQLKRFAHSSATTSVKIESHVRFPSTLDMRPYVDFSSSSKSVKDNKGKELPDSLYIYDLFAVVTHEGKLDNGHYWADVRDGEEWWHCDDDKVTPTSLSAVLAQRAYMLFYVKRSIAYAQPMSKLLASGSTAPNGA
ncbi:ubiquitin carboxyl-terminal hydrolase 22/27/51 [Cryptococcus deuterogattii 2001/935-1]|nr:ubiquitin carboxyl-terminal hydrolase 22/27/51 [Cryptococcus deuterogattii 2001/935-1]